MSVTHNYALLFEAAKQVSTWFYHNFPAIIFPSQVAFAHYKILLNMYNFEMHKIKKSGKWSVITMHRDRPLLLRVKSDAISLTW